MFDVDSDSTQPVSPGSRKRPGAPVEWFRLRELVQAYRRVVIIVSILSSAAGAVVAKLVVPREFTSRMVLLWEPSQSETVESSQNETEPHRELGTQLDMLKLPETLEAIRKELAIKATVESVASRIGVSTSESSNLVTLTGIGKTPDEARDFLAVVARMFLAKQDAVREEQAEGQRASVRASLGLIETKLRSAEEAYDAFKRENGIQDVEAERLSAIDSVSSLEVEVERSRVARHVAAAEGALLREEAQREPEEIVVSRTRSRPTATLRSKLKADFKAKRAALSEEHPAVRALEASISALGIASELGSEERSEEVATVTADVVGPNQLLTNIRSALLEARARARSAETSEQAYAAALTGLRQKVRFLTGLQSKARAWEEKIEVLEKSRLGLIEQEHRLLDIMGVGQQSFRPVAGPTLPIFPSKSFRKVAAAAIPLLALMLTVFIALIRTMLRYRPGSAKEVAFWTSLPVFTSTNWPVREDEPVIVDLANLCGGVRDGMGCKTPQVLFVGEHAASMAGRIVARCPELKDSILTAPGVPSEQEEARDMSSFYRMTREASLVVWLVRCESVAPLTLLSHAQHFPVRKTTVVVCGLGARFALSTPVAGSAGHLKDTQAYPSKDLRGAVGRQEGHEAPALSQ